MEKKTLNKILFFLGAVVVFLVLAYGFVPQVIAGKVVNQSDITGYQGMSHEATTWDAAHPDDKTAWTNSMFSGMPTTMLTGNDTGDYTKPLYKLMLLGKRPATYLFISLLGAFLLMLALGINKFLAIGGAIAVTFCSYNMQIIQVGHNTKMQAIAFAPWVLAAVIFTYKSALKDGEGKKWLIRTVLGAALFGMALNFQIKANHVQISYYLAIVIFSYALVLLVWLLMRDKAKFGKFMAASGLLLVLGLVGIGTNANRLIPTWSYTQQTMRGGSDLSSDGAQSKGLNLTYATAWSYGWEELPNLMIPDFNGGSSTYSVNPNTSVTAKTLKEAGQPNVRQIAKALPIYWGPQPFTAGPMYMGAITIFLFILGLCLCKGKEKWWILIPTVIAILLAVGSHFMAFTKFWYYHMPFYSKFRTVSMALVTLQWTLPMLGFLALDKILKGGCDKKEFMKGGLIALAITGGFSLLCALFPAIAGSFTGKADANYPDWLVSAMIEDRLTFFRRDSLIALVLVAATFALLWWSYGFKDKDSSAKLPEATRKAVAAGAICLLVLVNMFTTGKRYLNKDHFVTAKEFRGVFTERPVDQYILQDKDPDYRVLDLSIDVFNDSWPSYYHKNIAGYSPVKLQRYQDLIEKHIIKEIRAFQKSIQNVNTIGEAEAAMPWMPVLSMLNDKYIIVDPNAAAITNHKAMGNCWLVDSVARAATPDEEIALLDKVDVRHVAILGPDFASVEMPSGAVAQGDTIALVSYAPNEMHYKYTTSSPRMAIFSEVYYPEGWVAKVDGEETDIFRSNWTLRGMNLPAGSHEIVMRFDPPSYKVGTRISRATSISLILLLLLALFGEFAIKK